MERARLLGVTGRGGPGSGYALGGRLVLTSAHVVAAQGARVAVFRPGGSAEAGGLVVWCGTPGGRDDAALVLVDDAGWDAPPGTVRWGRLVTDRPGTPCETWGVPDLAQRPGPSAVAEAAQLAGRINPGSGFVGNQYVIDVVQHPPQWSAGRGSPWGGLSGAAVFCDGLLTGVVAADRAHSAHGQLTAVPSYVLFHDAGFRGALARYTAAPAGLEAVEFGALADRQVSSGVLRSPAALLQAGRQTVPFHGREELLARLTAWCERAGFGAMLLHGPGGQGKTRLAHHLAHLLAAERWAVLWPHPDAAPERLREVRHASKPLLVVLDYAETRAEQLAALVEAAAGHPGGTAFKILLLARTDGDWWARAKRATRLAEDHLDGAPAQVLAPLEQDPAERPHAYRSAARALAAALPRVDGCAGADWPAVADALPVPRLDGDGYGNALTLQMTVLADLLDTGWASSGAAEPDGVEDRLLGHEHRYWAQTATAHGLSPALGPATLDAAMAAAHLVGAADREQADRVWRSLPALADQPRDRRDAVTAWIGSLYPSGARPWGGLQPDRLAERHLGRVLDASPELAEHLLGGADAAQLAQLLTVYARAAAHPVFGRRLDGRLTELCVRHCRVVAAQVVATATQTDHPAPLIGALDAVATDPGALDQLFALNELFPVTSHRLARTAARLGRSIAALYRALADADPDTYLPDYARSLNNLATRLADVGRHEEGLTVALEAVRIRRTLAGADPGAHLPGLASALNTLGVRLGDLGRWEDAVATSREAVERYRELGRTDAAFRPEIAMAVNNLAVALGNHGLPDEALTTIQEAVEHYRVLARERPEVHLPGLASALNNLTRHLSDAGRRREGLAASQEAVLIRRALADAGPDAHLADYSSALGNLAAQLALTGRPEEALSTGQEALRIRRGLAEANPDAHRRDLAVVLGNVAVWLADVGRHGEALSAAEEAVRITREAVEVNRDAHLPDLAMALGTLAARLAGLGRHEAALTLVEEAVGHYRALAQAGPGAHLGSLALSLNNLAIWSAEVGRHDVALATIREAVDTLRALVGTRRDAHLPDLAMALTNLALQLGDGGQPDAALAVVQEAVGIRRELADADREAHLPDLALSLNNLAVQLGDAERHPEALATIEEAVGIRRALAGASPDAYLPDLAVSLVNLANRLGDVGRFRDALDAAREAVGHYRALAGANPAAHLPHLAHSLQVLAVCLAELDEQREALATDEEAVAILRALTAVAPDTHLGDLARVLNNLAVDLYEAGRPEEARAASRESIAILRELADAHPAWFGDRLRSALALAELLELPGDAPGPGDAPPGAPGECPPAAG